jgi:hypothetical protein
MSRLDSVRERYQDLNARRFDANLDVIAEDVRFHAPGLGKDVQGRDTVLDVVRGFIESSDVHYEFLDAAELGPFVVSHLTTNANVDGKRLTWGLLQVERYEGDKVVEMWSLREGEPRPASGEGTG